MAALSYKGKHKDKQNKIALVGQASRKNNKGIALLPLLPRSGERKTFMFITLKLTNTGGKLKSASTSMAKSCHYAVILHLLLALAPFHGYNRHNCSD
jgi:hypothetical protein